MLFQYSQSVPLEVSPEPDWLEFKRPGREDQEGKEVPGGTKALVVALEIVFGCLWSVNGRLRLLLLTFSNYLKTPLLHPPNGS